MARRIFELDLGVLRAILKLVKETATGNAQNYEASSSPLNQLQCDAKIIHDHLGYIIDNGLASGRKTAGNGVIIYELSLSGKEYLS